MEKRGSKFGSAQRTDGDHQEAAKVPGPGAYSAAEAAAKITAGPKYGCNRSTNIFRFGAAKRYTTEKAKNLPGPGAYKAGECVGKEGRKFTLLGRPKTTERERMSPGPAAYNPKGIASIFGPRGFRSGSIIEASSFGTANPMKEPRNKMMAPGPGQYSVDEHSKVVGRSSPSWR